FAASGKHNDPYSVERVTDQDGTPYTHTAQPSQAFTSAVADNVTDVLKTVVDRGTGTAARLPGRDVAGKTGTTDGNKSAWFVGYTPQLSTAIGMYRMDDNEKNKQRQFLEMYGTGGQKKIHGASFPAEIWHDYMAQALKGLPAKTFPTPEPIGEIINDTPSPSVTPTPTQTVTDTPTPTPTPTLTVSPTPTPSFTCGNFGWNCNTNGGTSNGGTSNGGTTGGSTGGVTTSPSPTLSSGNSRGNGNGGIFGGPYG
ncbi:penicillin-binding transpeptidase domain-containing protein, partial [Streptomyces caeni]